MTSNFFDRLETLAKTLLTWRAPDRSFFIYLAVTLLIATIVTAIFVQFAPLSEFDLEFSEEVQEHQFPLLDSLMKAISWFGNGIETGIVVLGISIGLFIAKHKRAAWSTLATLLATPFILLLKNIFDRPRPSSDLVTTMYEATQQSFPSGHTVFYTLFFGFLLYLSFVHRIPNSRIRWTLRFFLAFLIIGVSVSRIYLGAHWLTDVLAGYFIGGIFLIVWCQAYARWLRNCEGGMVFEH